MFPSSISSSDISGSELRPERRRVARFVLRAGLFVLPVAVAVGLIEVGLYRRGDSWSARHVAELQLRSRTEIIYARGYFEETFSVYKLAAMQLHKPRIVAVGSSRVMQLRHYMFPSGHSTFYNTGGAVQSAEDLAAFTDMIVGNELHRPKLVIVGIDPWWLKAGGTSQTRLRDRDAVHTFAGHIDALRLFVRKKGWRVAGRVSATHIGSVALRTRAGFRRDGSFAYPAGVNPQAGLESPFAELDINAAGHLEVPQVHVRIKRLLVQFAPPTHVDAKRLRLIVDSLGALRQHGIGVWAVMPPFASKAFAAFEESAALRSLWQTYRDILPRELESQGVTVVPMAANQGELDDFMLCGFHGSEALMSRLVREASLRAPYPEPAVVSRSPRSDASTAGRRRSESRAE